MYTFVFSINSDLILASIPDKATSFPQTFTDLASNPFSRAKETDLDVCKYYTNSGKYCILFDVDESNQEVIIWGIVHRSYLHKLMTGRIMLGI